jgi:hypothetical protein
VRVEDPPLPRPLPIEGRGAILQWESGEACRLALGRRVSLPPVAFRLRLLGERQLLVLVWSLSHRGEGGNPLS